MPNRVVADGEDVAISHINTRLTEDLRFTALYCVAEFYFQF